MKRSGDYDLPEFEHTLTSLNTTQITQTIVMTHHCVVTTNCRIIKYLKIVTTFSGHGSYGD